MNKIKLSLIVPCYNEEKNIPLLIDKLKREISRDYFEFILVDNGSSDNTRGEIKKYIKKYKTIRLIVIEENIGYGNGIFLGLKSAKGEYIGWTHADLQTNPKDAIRALEIIKKAKNPRKSYIKGRRYGRPIFDIFFTVGMALFETFLLNKILWDINAQPNVFHKSFLSLMRKPPKDFSFDLYTYYLAKSSKYKIVRFPVYFGKRIYGESSWDRSILDKWKFIKRTINYSFNLKKQIKTSGKNDHNKT